MALQQPEGRGAAQRINHDVNVCLRGNLTSIDCSLQHLASNAAAPPCKLRQKAGARSRVRQRLGNQADESRACYSPRLQVHNRVKDVREIAGDIASIGILQLSFPDLKIEVYTQGGFSRPMPV